MKRILAAALLFATPVFAQGTAAVSPLIAGFDSRWQPFLGCWRIVEDQQGGQVLPVAPGVLVCVQPSGSSAVAITTSLEGRTVLEQTITADGIGRSIDQTDCTGTQLTEWSRDGERLFTRLDLQCAGQGRREIAGITLLAGGFWIDAQASTSGDQDLKLRRYQRTTAPAVRRAGNQMSIEDVIEASPKVPAPALAAAIAASGTSFSVDSATLIRLAEEGVSADVIDVMVAQAYPDQFASSGSSSSPSSYQSLSGTAMPITGSAYPTYAGSTIYPTYPLSFYDPFYASYYHYYYSPFAYYSYWGSPYYPYQHAYRYRSHANFYRYYPRNGVAVAPYSGANGYGRPDRRPGSPGGDGAVVNGRGYTRGGSPASPGAATQGPEMTGTTPQPAPIVGTARSRATAGSAGSSGSSGSSGSRSSGSSSSSGSSGSSSSGSSGSGGARGWSGGSGGGGRTAQPR